MSEKIRLTDEEKEIGNSLDKIAKKENSIGWGSGFLTKETIDTWHDTMKRLRFKLEYGLDDIPDLVNKGGQGSPVVVLVNRKSYSPDDTEVLMTREDAYELEKALNFVKYKFTHNVYSEFKATRPDLFVKQNYLNPASITDPIAIQFMGDVAAGPDLRDVFDLDDFLDQAFSEYDKVQLPEPFNGPAYQIGIEQGDVNGTPTTLEFYVGKSAKNKSTIPDIAVLYTEGNVLGFANTKAAYITKEGRWKDDYGPITRLLKKILEQYHMTDFKKDITNRKNQG